jgi:protein phosphatase
MAVRIDSNQPILGYIESQIGGRSENQDSAGFKDVALGSIIVVCDGMGGGNGGSTASRLAVQTVIDDISEAKDYHDPVEKLESAIKHANAVIYATGNADASLKGMGTTLTAILISKQSAVVAHVGDSRVYQLRGGKKVFRTNDHSMVFQMVKQGYITEEEARNHPQSNVILSALGIGEEVVPEIVELSYNKGDRFVLCTDGFWGAMPEEEFVRHLSENNPINKILDSTANVVESIGRNSGNEYDNLTAAILEMNSNSILKEKMNKKAKLIIVILAVLLIVSIILNVSMLIGKGSSNGECNNVDSELMNNQKYFQAKDSVEVKK